MNIAELLESLPDDPVDASVALCAEFDAFWRQASHGTNVAEAFPVLLEFYAALQAYAQVVDDRPIHFPAIIGTSAAAAQEIRHAFTTFQSQVRTLKQRTEFKSEKLTVFERIRKRLPLPWMATFARGDADTIQAVLKRMQRDIEADEEVAAKHKERLLERIKHLQAELDESSLYVEHVLAFILDASIVLAPAGSDPGQRLAPLAEILTLAHQAQARALGLPRAEQRLGFPPPELPEAPERR